MSPLPSPQLQALLAHAGWIRSLARHLAADADRADDLVQRTFVAAIEHPPGPSTPLKRWLGAIVRHFAWQDLRGDARRAARESAAARPEASLSAHEVVEAVAIQRELYDAVLALAEPYRATILARFYEGLPPREIARRQGVPVKTVKTRLDRGLAKLREALDRGHGGDREAWLPALLPLAHWPGLPASTLGTLLVNTKIQMAIGIAALAGAVAIVWRTLPASSPRPEPVVQHDVESALSREREEPAKLTGPAKVGAREPDAGETNSETPGASPPVQPSVDAIATGRVVDVEGRAIAGVALALVGSVEVPGSSVEHRTTSRADGSFEVPVPKGMGYLVSVDPAFATVLGADVWSRIAQRGIVVVVAPAIEVSGDVVDPDGRAIEGAEVAVKTGRAFAAATGLALDASLEIPRRMKTDADGRFELDAVPSMNGARLDVQKAGFEPAAQPAPDRPAHDIRVVLARAQGLVLRGLVEDPSGKAVASALVACGGVSVRSDDQGRFELEPGEAEKHPSAGGGWQSKPQNVITAIKPGFLPGRFEKPAGGWPSSIEIRLGAPPLSISGRVADSSRAPVPGATVWIVDEQEFGTIIDPVGATAWSRSVESLLRDEAVGSAIHADDEGRFEIAGLTPRTYRLTAFDGKTLRAASSEPIQAGSRDALLVLPSAETCKLVAGRVVSKSGKPVPGELVFPGRPIQRWPFMGATPPPVFGGGETTDAEGRFRFEALSTDDLCFQVSGRDIDVLFRWEPPAGARLDALEIPVELRCHLQVDLGSRGAEADSFRVLDVDGRELTLVSWRGPRGDFNTVFRLTDGRSEVVSAPETARTVVLQKGGAEVARLAVEMVPGETVVVRL
jgi:RNA polymerase sigma-70 factor (ECF subfamily)